MNDDNTAMATLCARLESEAPLLTWHCPGVDSYQAEWNGHRLYVSTSHAMLGDLMLPDRARSGLLALAREATAARILADAPPMTGGDL